MRLTILELFEKARSDLVNGDTNKALWEIDRALREIKNLATLNTYISIHNMNKEDI